MDQEGSAFAWLGWQKNDAPVHIFDHLFDEKETKTTGFLCGELPVEDRHAVLFTDAGTEILK
ncbi:MAG: hypothetical protein RL275_2012, partial [Chloroflexota bacterium]